MRPAVMQPLTLAEIDRELATHTAQFDTITGTLLELDRHPGLGLLRRFGPTGFTERRWRPLSADLDLMWQDHARLNAILDAARTVRGTRGRLDLAERAELTRLLRGRPHEAARTPIPLGERSLTGPSEQVLFVGLADTIDRMRATFPRIAAFLDEVAVAGDRVVAGLAPMQQRLERVGTRTPELRSLAAEVDELLRRSATDPLAVAADGIDAQLIDLRARLEESARSVAELEAILADWDAAVALTEEQLTALRVATAHAERVRAEAEAKVHTAPLPTVTDESAALAAALAGLARDPEGLLALREHIDTALGAAVRATDLAQGLLDRRAELRGRLDAYRVKAARLGIAEDRDVMASHRIAAGLLARKPCDLGAVTRAVTDYQQLIAEKSGRGS
ncbi:hypothetical protein [Nocardia puris]|nr:hypothetical protein [Nocardia puris]